MPHKFNPNFAAEIRRQKARNAEIRVPRWWSKEVKAGTAIGICPNCQALFFDKHWHTWSNVSVHLPTGHKVREIMCDACKLLGGKSKITDFGYQGEFILSGLAEGERKLEMLRLIRNAAARALKRDPEEQIIKIEDKGRTVRVTTTANQLAVTLGKEIDSAFKGGKLDIRFSEDNLPVRVFWKDKV
jgi:hypothetical protein